ncbi:unnamed protein product, partial [Mesorhabditis belari]|uniref:Acyltransferase 3 domain-containing protein n=1 Tax=Mesorhabditis belari TaxID=2138241 RepID=A0AAF3FH56_9BILA
MASVEILTEASLLAPGFRQMDLRTLDMLKLLQTAGLNENETIISAGNESKTCLLDSFFPETVGTAVTPLLAWGCLVLMGTFVAKSPLRSLSLQRSWQELTTGRQSRLNMLDCFRVIAILWVMMNHTGSEGRVDILDRLPSAETFKHNVHTHPIFGALLGNSALGVEVFLVLSGMLGARSWLRNAEDDFWSHYRSFIGRRILRLFPSIAFFVYLAAGPIMKAVLPRYTSTMISDCGLQGLLSHLTFTGNWQSTPTCMGYLWYLGLDMQLHLALPFLLHLLVSNKVRGLAVIFATIATSCVLRAAHCSIYGVCNKSDVDIPFISYPDSDPIEILKAYEGLWDMYARPYTKCGPFLVGVLLGYATVYIKAEFSPRFSSTLFTASALTCVGVIYAILPEYWYPEMSTNLYNLSYTATFRTIFSIGICGMIAALYWRKNSVQVSPLWSILARLTFSVYLLHMPIVYIFNHLPYLQTAHGAVELLVVLPFVSILSFFAAIIFYLFIESPIGNLSNQCAKQLGL